MDESERVDEREAVALIDRVLDGETGAWTKLVALFYPHAIRIARSHMRGLRDSHNLEEHVRNVATAVFTRLSSNNFRALATSRTWRQRNPGKEVRGWLARVVTNVARDYVVAQLGAKRRLHLACSTRQALGKLRVSIDPVIALELVGIIITFRDRQTWEAPLRHTFRADQPPLEIDLPTAKTVVAIMFEYHAGDATTELSVSGVGAGEQAIELGTASVNRQLNQHQLNTLATALPAPDFSPGARPAVTDRNLVLGILAYAADNLTIEQFRALEAWLGDAELSDVALAAGVPANDPELAKRGDKLVRSALAKLRRRFSSGTTSG